MEAEDGPVYVWGRLHGTDLDGVHQRSADVGDGGSGGEPSEPGNSNVAFERLFGVCVSVRHSFCRVVCGSSQNAR